MNAIANVIAGFVAFEHLAFMVLEMFLWTTPFGMKTFKRSKADAESSRTLAANQGLYNGFLAAGLFWGLLAAAPQDYSIKLFFLGCVFVAGIYGGATASKSIFLVQALPAAVGLGVLVMSHGG